MLLFWCTRFPVGDVLVKVTRVTGLPSLPNTCCMSGTVFQAFSVNGRPHPSQPPAEWVLRGSRLTDAETKAQRGHRTCLACRLGESHLRPHPQPKHPLLGRASPPHHTLCLVPGLCLHRDFLCHLLCHRGAVMRPTSGFRGPCTVSSSRPQQRLANLCAGPCTGPTVQPPGPVMLQTWGTCTLCVLSMAARAILGPTTAS